MLHLPVLYLTRRHLMLLVSFQISPAVGALTESHSVASLAWNEQKWPSYDFSVGTLNTSRKLNRFSFLSVFLTTLFVYIWDRHTVSETKAKSERDKTHEKYRARNRKPTRKWLISLLVFSLWLFTLCLFSFCLKFLLLFLCSIWSFFFWPSDRVLQFG